ncbi:MAG TPA: DnaJ domain-containing protein [Chloroflexota bacterium]
MSSLPLVLVLLASAVVLGVALTLLVQHVLLPERQVESYRNRRSKVSRRPVAPVSPPPSDLHEFEGEPFPQPGPAGETPKEPWNPHRRARATQGQRATYRVPRGNSMRPGDQWNPFAEEQSRASRIKAARRRPRKVTGTPDYYSLLGLERGASDAQIEQAYRRHAALIHPDRFYDDPERREQAEAKLKQLNAAMQVLRDPLMRARYDANLS